MKKIFTLLACVLMAGSAFGQERWKDLVVNGNMESAQDPKWSSFWCHDWRENVQFDPETGQKYDESTITENSQGMFQGFAEIVEDPVKAGNHCARVIIRTREQAEAAGNKTIDTQNNKPDWVEWDSQFFIYANETIPEGKEVRLTLRIRGEKAGKLQTQAHFTPGDYNHYQLFGDIEYTTEWQKKSVTATVSSSHTQESNGKFFQSVAFNLSTMQDGNTVYFDDVKLEIRDPKEEDPNQAGQFFNLLRHGTQSADKFGSYTTFTARNGATGNDEPAPIVNDPVDGQPALTVATIAYNAQYSKPKLDEEGNPVLDENNQPTFEDPIGIYITEKGDTIKKQDGNFGIDDWKTQFFVTVSHKWKKGEKYKLVMWARADKDLQLDTQCHTMPGSYVHYNLCGSLDLTSEWTKYEFGVSEDDVRTIPSEAGNDCQTIAFNCNKLKDEAANIYFRFEEFSFTEGNIKDEERVLGEENLNLPVNDTDDGTSTTVDMAEMLTTLEAEDFGFMNDYDEGDGIRYLTLIQPEDDDPYDGYTSARSWTDEGFLNAEGYFIDSDDPHGISIMADDSSIDGSKVNFIVLLDPDANISLAENNVDTKICIGKGGWYYIYNVTLMDETKYNTGIAPVKQVKTDNGLIYNIAGQRVDGSYKGLVIKNGQKMIQK